MNQNLYEILYKNFKSDLDRTCLEIPNYKKISFRDLDILSAHFASFLNSLGLKKGDYLWTTPISFVSSSNCALFCGASVDFVDIDLDTGLMSIDPLKEKLIQAEKNKLLPKILVPVHLGGASCDMEEIYLCFQ